MVLPSLPSLVSLPALSVHIHECDALEGRLSRPLIPLAFQVDVVLPGHVRVGVLALVQADEDEDDELDDGGDEAGDARTGIGLHLELEELGLGEDDDAHDELSGGRRT